MSEASAQDSLQDRVVVITGAARGMGRAYARGFLQRGARVVATDRSWSGEDEFRGELERSERAITVNCDVTSAEQVAHAYGETMARFGTVDVLVNNAALRMRDLYPVAGAASVLETEDEHWTRMFAINVTGVVTMTRQFIKPMLEQQRGSVVNVSASGSLTQSAGDGQWRGNHPSLLNQPYDASKAALTSMSFYLAEEVKPRNVAVNVIFPGATRTTGSDALMVGRRALGFAFTMLRPEHVVPLVLHLATQDASGETGRAYDVLRWNETHGHGNATAWLA